MKIRASAFTECGPHRERNEDYIYSDETQHLFVVADGMGGLSNGQYASCTATNNFVKQFSERIERNISSVMAGEAAILQTNKYLYDAAREKNIKCGTTLTAVHVPNPMTLNFFHVGDSALWRIDRRKSTYEILTRFDTLESEYVLKGTDLLTASRYKNVLTMAIGLSPYITPQIGSVAIGDADFFVACSDGFANSIKASDLIALSTTEKSIEEITHSARRLAAESFPNDNFSAIFFGWEKI